MAELLTSLAEINGQLPIDQKAECEEGDNHTQLQVDAQRMIKSQLSGVFLPTTLTAWNSPANTPGLIRSVAAKLIAAKWYAELYAGDSDDIPDFAQSLYDEGMTILKEIRAGNLIVLDSTNNPIEDNALEPSTADFWPNNTTPGPYFEMEKEWA